MITALQTSKIPSESCAAHIRISSRKCTRLQHPRGNYSTLSFYLSILPTTKQMNAQIFNQTERTRRVPGSCNEISLNSIRGKYHGFSPRGKDIRRASKCIERNCSTRVHHCWVSGNKSKAEIDEEKGKEKEKEREKERERETKVQLQRAHAPLPTSSCNGNKV